MIPPSKCRLCDRESEGWGQGRRGFLPERGAVEVDEHPFMGVEVKGFRVFHPVQQMPEFGADECCS